MSDHEPALAVLVDFENMARPGIKGRDDFDVAIVLNRLADKGRVLVKRAYADWSRYRDARHALISAGLELIEMPSAREGAKNRADIKMAVDAMELVYSREHLDNFVLVSGDSDFTPLVGKLRELNKRVIGVGNRESTSELLIANCDEFIFYDKLAGTSRARRGNRTDPVELLKETLAALSHESTELPLASVVKDSMRRKSPAFDETDLGFANFSRFLEDVAEKGHVTLQTDPRSGTYRVEMPEEQRGTVTAVRPRQAPDREEAGDGRRRRRRSRRSRGGREDGPEEGGAEVFEFVVASDPEAEGDEALETAVVIQDISAGLPPLDEPISYEHVVLLAPELDLEPNDETDLVEASDAPPAEKPAPARRGRRKVSAEPAETAETPPEPAAAGAEEAGVTPGRRRRVRRRTSAEPAEATPAAHTEPVSAPAEEAVAAPEAEAPAEETSRRRRTVRRRGASAPDAATTEAAEPEAEEKPKRRRSSRAKAAEPEAEAGEASGPDGGEPPADATPEAAEPEAEEKPKRRRRTARAAATADEQT